MKFLASIMAVIILALSMMPCTDEEALMHAGNTSDLAQQAKCPEQQHSDDCSPLCTCSCCASFFAFFQSSNKANLVLQAPAPVYSSLVVSTTFSIPLPIWQPPRSA